MSYRNLTQRLRDATRRGEDELDIGANTFITAFVNIYNNNDVRGLQDLFAAYRDWHMSAPDEGYSYADRLFKIKEYFEGYAIAADVFERTGNLAQAKEDAELRPAQAAGPITDLYRTVVDYTPRYS